MSKRDTKRDKKGDKKRTKKSKKQPKVVDLPEVKETPVSIVAKQITHPTLDEIISGSTVDVQILSEPTSKARAATIQVENKIFQEIMAKMNVRNVDVEKKRDYEGSRSEPKYVESHAKLSERVGTNLGYQREKSTYKISRNNINEITRLLEERKKSGPEIFVEMEASFGIFKRTFEPGLKSGFDFKNLKTYLSTSASPKFSYMTTEDVVEIMEDGRGNIRCIYDPQNPKVKKWERKQRQTGTRNTIEIRELGVRITSSIENDAELKPNVWKPHLKRERTRTSFRVNLTIDKDQLSSSFQPFVIDITKVQETPIIWDGEIPSYGNTFIKNEVEIEIASKVSGLQIAENFAKIIEYVYRASICNLNQDEGVEIDESLFDLKQRAYAVKLHNTLFEQDIRALGNKYESDEYTMYDRAYWNKPKNIKLKYLQPVHNRQSDKYIFYLQNAPTTVKLNGTRFFLLMAQGCNWLLMPPYTVVKFGEIADTSYDGTYIDGELEQTVDEKTGDLKYIFHGFDILFYKGADVRMKPHNVRYEMVTDACSIFRDNITFKTIPKVYFTGGSLYDRIRSAHNAYIRMITKDKDSADGIIIQSPYKYSGGYTLNKAKNFIDQFATYKWKPSDQLTIDFKAVAATLDLVKDLDFPRINKKNVDKAFILKIKKGPLLQPFRQTTPVKYDGDMILDSKTIKAFNLTGDIVECKWDYKGNQFIPVRSRDDRSHPNYIDTATDVWEDIHNPVKISTLTGDDLILLRKRHNIIKDLMINKYIKKGATIVDIGSGRGGDLSKWRRAGIKKVYAVEPSFDESKKDDFSVNTREEFIKRLKEEQKLKGAPDVELVKYGIENTKQIKNIVKGDTIDTVVSFFSLTFMAENEAKFTSFMKTIDLLVPVGGLFIGTVMDGHRVFDLLTRSGKLESATTDELRSKIKSLRNTKVDIFDANYGVAIDEDVDYISAEYLKRENPDYTAFEEGTALAFDTNAFTIAQSDEYGFDMTDPFENQITITIHDPTSMVNYTEWLFNYKDFKIRMEDLGFVEKSSFYLDDDETRYLPKDSFVFSALNRSFVFERVKKL